MSIVFDSENRIFTLNTNESSYQMQISETGYLLHLYYGGICSDCCDYLYPLADRGFSPNPYELREARNWSLDQLPQEVSTSNGGDYRTTTIDICTASGIVGCNLLYKSHEITGGKFTLKDLPYARGEVFDCDTLSIVMADELAGIEVELLYAVYGAEDVITRALRIRNTAKTDTEIDAASSACLDLPYSITDMIHFHGRHAMEMQKERISIPTGITKISSSRGMTSHQHNPFVICLEKETGEEYGNCYGIMLAYSGNYSFYIEKDQSTSVRIVSGINRNSFSWTLEPGACFEVPEVFFSYSGKGLTRLSQNYHKYLNRYVMRRPADEEKRPVLLNSWEALYCEYDETHILKLAEKSKELGVDLFVIDDGWFGNRIDDKRSLGDWHENPRKFPSGLKTVAEKITAMGLKLGIWLEPEMISEDSSLINEHPEWVLRIPGRKPTMGREQMVLDLSRGEVVDHLEKVISGLLKALPISYIKWDMNRGLSDLYSPEIKPERMRELPHRYLLGLYSLLDRLTKAFPKVLFEGCAGGGGRFDAAMLHYFPQMWTSDNTDAVARLSIQQGAAYGYPVSAQGSHVSAVPNHQTGRSTPFGVRGIVAMSGSFGYELDPAKLSKEEMDEIHTQIEDFRKYEALIHEGLYYRLTDAIEDRGHVAWQFVSEDKSETLLNVVITKTIANPNAIHIRLKGLNPDARYEIIKENRRGDMSPKPAVWLSGKKREGMEIGGDTLMKAGLTITGMQGDYPGVQYYLKQI